MWSALAPTAARAQAERYELGRRVIAFERAFDAQPEAAARARVTSPLKQATFAFFAGKPGDAGRLIDQARFALQSADPPAPAVRWAESLHVRPERRLFDASTRLLTLELSPFYDAGAQPPSGPRLEATLHPLDGGEAIPLGAQPLATEPVGPRVSFPVPDSLPAGDYDLRVHVVADGKSLAETTGTVSFAPDVAARVRKIAEAAEALPDTTPATERLTLKELASLLTALAEGKPRETNYPAARLLTEAEAVRADLASERRYYGQRRPGEFWLRLPTPGWTTAVRLLAPKSVRTGEPLPLVVALHGAGGSENMFFDAYGHGGIVNLCRERGWLLVAPRSGFTGATPVADLTDAVNSLYPVDRKRVYVVGHSMGAGQAMAAVGRTPEQIAAVAALGGSGTVRASEELKRVAFFVGVGTEDFALAGARALRRRLEQAGVGRVTYKEFPGLEHLLIVQVGLREVFAFFDRVK